MEDKFYELNVNSQTWTRTYKADDVVIAPAGCAKDPGIHYSKTGFSEHIRTRCEQAITRTYHIFKGLCSKNKADKLTSAL